MTTVAPKSRGVGRPGESVNQALLYSECCGGGGGGGGGQGSGFRGYGLIRVYSKESHVLDLFKAFRFRVQGWSQDST